MNQHNNAPVFLVFGALGGIGSELSRRLEASGARVAVAGRNLSRTEDGGIRALAGRHEVDATNFEQIESAFRETLASEGHIDGVANCVGSLLLKPAHLTTPEEWQTTLDVNLGSSFGVARAAGKLMKDGGSVVLVSSAAARVGLANHEAIAAAKAGVIGLMQSAAASYAHRGIRFNAVAPGLVRTPMTERITGSETAAKASTAMHVLGRLGEPSDVASMIEWLLRPEQNWITGQVFGADGGLATVRSRGTA